MSSSSFSWASPTDLPYNLYGWRLNVIKACLGLLLGSGECVENKHNYHLLCTSWVSLQFSRSGSTQSPFLSSRRVVKGWPPTLSRRMRHHSSPMYGTEQHVHVNEGDLNKFTRLISSREETQRGNLYSQRTNDRPTIRSLFRVRESPLACVCVWRVHRKAYLPESTG